MKTGLAAKDRTGVLEKKVPAETSHRASPYTTVSATTSFFFVLSVVVAGLSTRLSAFTLYVTDGIWVFVAFTTGKVPTAVARPGGIANGGLAIKPTKRVPYQSLH